MATHISKNIEASMQFLVSVKGSKFYAGGLASRTANIVSSIKVLD
jgi:hypothetical protein